MLLTLLQFFATKFLVLALHLEAGSFPKPLSAREEIETFAALRAGDRSAREKIIRHNLRLVAHIVKKYYAQTGDQDDLISIGTIGLIKGISTFKSDKNVRLATYASRCIEKYYPHIAELSEDEVAKQAPFGAKWRLLAQVEVRCYILISNISGSVKVAPLQILQFPVILPHKFQDAESSICSSRTSPKSLKQRTSSAGFDTRKACGRET